MWLPFVTKLVGLTARGGNINLIFIWPCWYFIYTILKSFKFVLVWHRTCEKIEATQKTDYIHRWQMT